MKVASIDIGTNSIRLLLAEYDGQFFTNVSKKLQMTRLGKGVNETGLLDQERVLESVEVLKAFCDEAEFFGAEKIVMMATSAVRDSKNANQFVEAVYKETGRMIEVITGDLEAEIGFLGVLLGIEDQERSILVIDIGGGSTELIIGNKNGIQFSKSLNIGAVRLTGTFIGHDPVTESEISQMQSEIEKHLNTVKEELLKYRFDEVIGIGGTATTFATIAHKVTKYDRDLVHGLKVKRKDLETLNRSLSEKTVEERKAIPGLEPKRADIIFAGGLILEAILKMIQKDEFSVSDYDNLEGFLAYKYDK